MTDIYIRNRIDDIDRIIDSLEMEVVDPDSKGPSHARRVRRAINSLTDAVSHLNGALGSNE